MEKREPLFTEEHFSELIKELVRVIDKREQGVSNQPEKYDMSSVYYNFYLDNRDLLIAKYSAGYPIEELKDHAEQAIKWLFKNNKHPDSSPFFLDELEDYVKLIQLLSFSYLFNLDKEPISNLLNLLAPHGEDALLDKLALFIEPNRKQGNKLQQPRAYQALCDVINAGKEDQPKLMQKFLKGWYKSMRKCGWHDVHLSVGKDGFPGYWCWEAAMVTLLYDIDDSSYQDMLFYPKDLVTYAKQQKR